MAPGLSSKFFYEEEDGSKLWVPIDSQALVDKKFADEHFASSGRFQGMIVENDNVLTPAVIQGVS